MTADRYLRLILTVIALELLWIGVRDGASPLIAQQQSDEPMPVVITGFRIDDRDYTTLPVAVVGAWRPVPGHKEFHMMQPLQVRLSEPLQLDPKYPVTVQTGTRPLSVESVPAKPGPRPGF
jgi:hypothetical protein